MRLIKEGKTNWLYIVIVLVSAILGSVGVFYCWNVFQKQTTEPSVTLELTRTKDEKGERDEIYDILDELREEIAWADAGDTFTEIKPIDSEWSFLRDSRWVEIDEKKEFSGFFARDKFEQVRQQVKDFFTQKQFGVVRFDTYPNWRGSYFFIETNDEYKKGEIACLMSTEDGDLFFVCCGRITDREVQF